eukprot:666314-Prymnesium_polylepis.1
MERSRSAPPSGTRCVQSEVWSQLWRVARSRTLAILIPAHRKSQVVRIKSGVPNRTVAPQKSPDREGKTGAGAWLDQPTS